MKTKRRREALLTVETDQARYRRWKKAAKSKGLTLSAWTTVTLDAASESSV